jgi:hypothetical protein
MRIGAVTHATAVSGSDRGPQFKRFSLHVIEMTVAMMLGMCVLGTAFRALHLAVFGTGFDAAWHDHTELAVFAMTFNMTLPMVALMRYRGHAWDRCSEMAAAMFVLAFALLVPFWLGALSADAVLPLEMALMLPAMIAVMAHRVDEYAGPRGSASASAERAP